MVFVDAALVKEQGVSFAVVSVRKHVVYNDGKAQEVMHRLGRAFNVPVVLMGQDHGGSATYYGRRDIVRFLASLPSHRTLPWKRWSLS